MQGKLQFATKTLATGIGIASLFMVACQQTEPQSDASTATDLTTTESLRLTLKQSDSCKADLDALLAAFMAAKGDSAAIADLIAMHEAFVKTCVEKTEPVTPDGRSHMPMPPVLTPDSTYCFWRVDAMSSSKDTALEVHYSHECSDHAFPHPGKGMDDSDMTHHHHPDSTMMPHGPAWDSAMSHIPPLDSNWAHPIPFDSLMARYPHPDLDSILAHIPRPNLDSLLAHARHPDLDSILAHCQRPDLDSILAHIPRPKYDSNRVPPMHPDSIPAHFPRPDKDSNWVPPMPPDSIPAHFPRPELDSNWIPPKHPPVDTTLAH